MSEEVGVVRVKSMFIYPIKSCRGISVTQASIVSTGTIISLGVNVSSPIVTSLHPVHLGSPRWEQPGVGFRWDRQWMIVNSKGRMCSQRVEPKLALVQVEFPTQAFSDSWEPSANSYMVIRGPGMDVLKVNLGKPQDMVDNVSVWDWSGSAFDEGAEAAQWFSKYLAKTSRLVRFDPESQVRSTNPDYVVGYRTMFPDRFPFLLASQESLDAVNSTLNEPVSINRFRPNILVEGCAPFSEDLWKEIQITNKLTFIGVRLCARCKMPSIDQETGIPDSELGKTLETFRSDRVLRPNKKSQGQVYFGKNLVCKESISAEKGKVVQVGDPVFVIEQLSSVAESAV